MEPSSSEDESSSSEDDSSSSSEDDPSPSEDDPSSSEHDVSPPEKEADEDEDVAAMVDDVDDVDAAVSESSVTEMMSIMSRSFSDFRIVIASGVGLCFALALLLGCSSVPRGTAAVLLLLEHRCRRMLHRRPTCDP